MCPQRSVGGQMRLERGEMFGGHDERRPHVEDVPIGAQGLDLGPRCFGKLADVRFDAAKGGEVRERRIQHGSDAIDVPHRLRDLDVAVFVEVFQGKQERLEGLAPQLVDAFLAAPVPHQLAELQRFLQMVAALPHEGVVGLDLDAEGLDLHQLGEDARGAVEQRSSQYAPFTRRRCGSVSCSKARRASSRRVPGTFNPCSV